MLFRSRLEPSPLLAEAGSGCWAWPAVAGTGCWERLAEEGEGRGGAWLCSREEGWDGRERAEQERKGRAGDGMGEKGQSRRRAFVNRECGWRRYERIHVTARFSQRVRPIAVSWAVLGLVGLAGILLGRLDRKSVV